MSSLITTTIPADVTGLSRTEQELLASIMQDVKRGLDAIMRAARTWMELSEKARGRIVEQTRPSLRDFWTKLERVGAGELHPQLATVSGLAARYLGKLPIEEQERYLRDGIPVASLRNKDHRLVDVVLMTEEQRKQVFTGNGSTTRVRSVEEQRVWLSDQAARRVLQKEKLAGLKTVDRVGWSVRSGKVFVKPARVETGLTRRDLETMLRDLE
ncbi:MAG: hypothetical protein J0L73_27755 [Verrucomicrobia bacterium]|nr:hypothetical protein [Verrucomicrobiota bacterium]